MMTVKSTLFYTYLGSYVVRSAAECLRKFAWRDAFFTHAKVGNLTMAVCVEKYIVQFQVPAATVNNSATT